MSVDPVFVVIYIVFLVFEIAREIASPYGK